MAHPYSGKLTDLSHKVSVLEAELTKHEPDLELYDGDYFRSIEPSRARKVGEDEILQRGSITNLSWSGTSMGPWNRSSKLKNLCAT